MLGLDPKLIRARIALWGQVNLAICYFIEKAAS
jgi:hypothetical protein